MPRTSLVGLVATLTLACGSGAPLDTGGPPSRASATSADAPSPSRSTRRCDDPPVSSEGEPPEGLVDFVATGFVEPLPAEPDRDWGAPSVESFDAPLPCPTELRVLEVATSPRHTSANVRVVLGQAPDALVVFATLHRSPDGWSVFARRGLATSAALNRFERALAAAPDVEIVTRLSRWSDDRQLLRVKGAESQICLLADGLPRCVRDEGAETSFHWSLDEDERAAHTRGDALPRRVRVARPEGSSSVRIVDHDLDALVARDAGSIRARRVTPEPMAFWMGRRSDPLVVPRLRRSRPHGAARPLEVVPPHALVAASEGLGITRVWSVDGTLALSAHFARDGFDAAQRALVCARLGDRFHCGSIEETSIGGFGAFGLDSFTWVIERVETLVPGRAIAIETATREDGGNGEGSGATGLARLLVLALGDDGRLHEIASLPIGAMEWETVDLCGEPPSFDRCYHRDVRRVHVPWRAGEGCLTFGVPIVEHVWADGAYARARSRQARRARPSPPPDVGSLWSTAFGGAVEAPSGALRLADSRMVSGECTTPASP